METVTRRRWVRFECDAACVKKVEKDHRVVGYIAHAGLHWHRCESFKEDA